jgi:hypothetical protein
MSWYINDLETQNHKWFGAVASPFCPDNYVVAAGWCIDNGEVQHKYFDSKEEADSSTWLADSLVGQKIYVAHNATFELHWLLHRHKDVILDWVKQGGRLYCSQYAEFLLSNHTNQYPTLEDCSVKYRDEGMSEHDVKKIDEVKILWGQGVLTADIDKELLLSYLCDDVHGDIANTRRVCFKQVAELKRRGMWKMFQIRMDSLLFNAIATFNGLYVNQPIAEKNLAVQLQAIEGLQDNILKQLPPDLPEELEFSFTSAYHRSAFLFGGDIKYRKKVPYNPVKFEKVNCYLFKGSPDVYTPIAQAPDNLEDYLNLVRYVSGKNKGKPKEFLVDSATEKLKWEKDAYTFKGLINLKELPKHVSEQYLGKRAEFKGKRDLTCGTPVYSTGAASLDILASFTDVAKPIKQLATLQKDTGTYYRMEKANGDVTGMLQFVEPDSIIHHNLNNCATITARLSGTRPNMTNLPRADEDDEGNMKSRVKEMFTSRFGSEGRIVEVDYSALEVVALAAISGDSNLMKMLTEGIDMHCYRLAAKLGEDYDEVKANCKDATHPEHARYSNMRTAIKPRAFAHQYGASAAGISYSTGCSLEEAEEFKAIEFKLFPQSNAYPTEVVRPEVESTGLMGLPEREVSDAGIWSIYRRGTFQAKSGTTYSFRQYNQWREGQQVLDYKDTQIANYWCQGEASFIVQAACGRVAREFLKRNDFNGKVKLINTVHDAIYLDAATEELAIEAAVVVREIMEDTPRWLSECIPALKEWGYDVVPFPAQAEQGASMAIKNHVH